MERELVVPRRAAADEDGPARRRERSERRLSFLKRFVRRSFRRRELRGRARREERFFRLPGERRGDRGVELRELALGRAKALGRDGRAPTEPPRVREDSFEPFARRA